MALAVLAGDATQVLLVLGLSQEEVPGVAQQPWIQENVNWR